MTTDDPACALDRALTPTALRLLVAVDELGGLGAAARACAMTQPAVSRRIALLEKALGYRLVNRTHLGSVLTERGQALVIEARAVLEAHDGLLRTALALADGGSELLQLAASRTVGEQLVPQWLHALSVADPGRRVSFRVGNSQRVIELVRSGTVPLGFVELPNPPVGLRSEVLRHDRLVVVPAGHPWAGGSVTTAQVAAEQLVEREAGSGTRAMLDVLMPARSAPVAEFDSNTAILGAVAAGVGPAVLSELAAATQPHGGRVITVPWQEPSPQRPLRAVWTGEEDSKRVAAMVLPVVRAAIAG